MSEIKRIGVMTGGGDCPGLNAVIRAVTKTAIMKYGLEVVGIKHGYRGLYLGGDEFVKLTLNDVSGVITKGGTMLYSSNKDNLFDYTYTDENGNEQHGDVSDVGVKNLKDAGIDALIVIGGDGTLTSGRDFSRKGVKVIGVPRLSITIWPLPIPLSVLTPLLRLLPSLLTDSEPQLNLTAELWVVEAMGRYAGFIGIASAIAGGCDAALIPEIPYDINKVADAIKANMKRGKNFALVVVSEGAKPLGGDVVVSKVVENSPDPIRLGGIGNVVAGQLEELVGLEARATILGHVQRGGTPTANDRILSTRYGSYAVELLMQGKFGNMVTLSGAELSYESLENVIGANKAVEEDSYWIKTARSIGVCVSVTKINLKIYKNACIFAEI